MKEKIIKITFMILNEHKLTYISHKKLKNNH